MKVPFEPVVPAELHEPVAFADAVADAGVATPRVLRAGEQDRAVQTVGECDRRCRLGDGRSAVPQPRHPDHRYSTSGRPAPA